MVVRQVRNDAEFHSELNGAVGRVVVVDFFAVWCGPCRTIAPTVDQLSDRYPRAVFLKVDVDQCQQTAAAHNVTAMPTFLFFLNKQKVDSLRGADPQQLEAKIKHWVETVPAAEPASGLPPGQLDLMGFVRKSDVECLNEEDAHNFAGLLNGESSSYLQSDCDEQLIISLPFNQPVKVHSLRIKGPVDNGPKFVKLFTNQPRTLDFDAADTMEAVQAIDFTADIIENGEVFNLRYVKFQNVQTLQVAGKKGESHG